MPQHNWFAGGEWNAACDICGRVFKSSKLSKAWDNSMRCGDCWEPRHPQDFIRAMPDNPTVPWSRPWIPPAGEGIWANNAGTILPWINGGGAVPWVY